MHKVEREEEFRHCAGQGAPLVALHDKYYQNWLAKFCNQSNICPKNCYCWPGRTAGDALCQVLHKSASAPAAAEDDNLGPWEQVAISSDVIQSSAPVSRWQSAVGCHLSCSYDTSRQKHVCISKLQ